MPRLSRKRNLKNKRKTKSYRKRLSKRRNTRKSIRRMRGGAAQQVCSSKGYIVPVRQLSKRHSNPCDW